MRVAEALALAEEDGLDLVEIAPNGEPPVCRIMDFGKYRFVAMYDDVDMIFFHNAQVRFRLSNEMATSLMNDSAIAIQIARNLVDVSSLLYLQRDLFHDIDEEEEIEAAA